MTVVIAHHRSVPKTVMLPSLFFSKPNTTPERASGVPAATETLTARSRDGNGRGSLRIYLGAFAGVRKTYAMLDEAQRRKRYGEVVVVGLVETHGRAQTAPMLNGLAIVPRARRQRAAEARAARVCLRARP